MSWCVKTEFQKAQKFFICKTGIHLVCALVTSGSLVSLWMRSQQNVFKCIKQNMQCYIENQLCSYLVFKIFFKTNW